MERLLTTDEVAEYLRVDVVTIRRLVSRGELTAYRIGSEYRFTPSDLDYYLQQQRVSTGTTPENIPLEWVRKALQGKHTGYPFCYKTPIYSSRLHRTKKFKEKNSI